MHAACRAVEGLPSQCSELLLALQPADGAAPDSSAPPPPLVLPPPPVALPANADPATRELAAAAQRYAAATHANAADYDNVYNHGLALQELATRTGGQSPEQFQLLSQACERYEAACVLRGSSHAALYNWGVALSDLARNVRGSDPAAAQDFLLRSAEKYGHSLKCGNPNNPQALNNWGLVLQELTGLRPPAERSFLVAAATAKFRRAIRLRPEFDRACYNLGTVFYSHAIVLQSEAEARPEGGEPGSSEKQARAVRQAFQAAAQYIALSQALQPGKDVYRKSLQVLRHMLPLPYLRVGTLLAAEQPSPAASGQHHEDGGSSSGSSRSVMAPLDERWHRCWFVLDADSFRSEPDAQRQQPGSHAGQEVCILLSDVQSAKPAADPSLPSGAALWLSLASRPQGLYFVAQTREEADGWVDALTLAGHLAGASRLTALRQSLAPTPATGSSSGGAPQSAAPVQGQPPSR